MTLTTRKLAISGLSGVKVYEGRRHVGNVYARAGSRFCQWTVLGPAGLGALATGMVSTRENGVKAIENWLAAHVPAELAA